MSCDCIDRVNADLAPRNATLLTNIFGAPRACITLQKLHEVRGKLPLLQASFCPFCGTQYPERTPFVPATADEGAERMDNGHNTGGGKMR